MESIFPSLESELSFSFPWPKRMQSNSFAPSIWVSPDSPQVPLKWIQTKLPIIHDKRLLVSTKFSTACYAVKTNWYRGFTLSFTGRHWRDLNSCDRIRCAFVKITLAAMWTMWDEGARLAERPVSGHCCHPEGGDDHQASQVAVRSGWTWEHFRKWHQQDLVTDSVPGVRRRKCQ